MAGVWIFRDGVAYLVQNVENPDTVQRRKVLVFRRTNQVISSYAELEQKLASLGWSRYNGLPDKLQFHKGRSPDLITLPRDSTRFTPIHMYDIVVKNGDHFEVREM